jgi:hypothetical protein
MAWTEDAYLRTSNTLRESFGYFESNYSIEVLHSNMDSELQEQHLHR